MQTLAAIVLAVTCAVAGGYKLAGMPERRRVVGFVGLWAVAIFVGAATLFPRHWRAFELQSKRTGMAGLVSDNGLAGCFSDGGCASELGRVPHSCLVKNGVVVQDDPNCQLGPDLVALTQPAGLLFVRQGEVRGNDQPALPDYWLVHAAGAYRVIPVRRTVDAGR